MTPHQTAIIALLPARLVDARTQHKAMLLELAKVADKLPEESQAIIQHASDNLDGHLIKAIDMLKEVAHS